jgi:hypothetical protein
MLEDYRKGRPLELSAIADAVFELAARVGMDLPVSRAVVDMARFQTMPPLASPTRYRCVTGARAGSPCASATHRQAVETDRLDEQASGRLKHGRVSPRRIPMPGPAIRTRGRIMLNRGGAAGQPTAQSMLGGITARARPHGAFGDCRCGL